MVESINKEEFIYSIIITYHHFMQSYLLNIIVLSFEDATITLGANTPFKVVHIIHEKNYEIQLQYSNQGA